MKLRLPNNLTKSINRIKFKTVKSSPEILAVAGVVGIVASGVMACKATLKVNDILNESKESIDKIHEVASDETKKEIYSEKDANKDLSLVYIQTGFKLAKLYAPSVILGTLSITSMLASNNILRKRYLASAAAYAGIENGFKEYRNRVIERFGEKVDKELKYNVKAKEIVETNVDEDGNEVSTVKTVDFVGEMDLINAVSPYARFFEKYTDDGKGYTTINPCWQPNNEYNIMFLKAQQNYANDKLKARRYLYLNEVYEMLGLPASQAGQIVGWVYDPENPVGDNYVDFGLYKSSDNYSDYIYGHDNGILLDFNVDGNIWELME